MSVTTLQSLFQYAIAALGQAFTPNCPIQNTSDFTVTYTNPTTLADVTLTLNVDYFVTGTFVAGVCAAPTITLEGSGLHYAIGGTLTIQRLPPDTQPTVYVDGTKYLAAVPNNSLDWLCYSIQALYDIVSRCIRVPATSAVQAAVLLVLRKGMLQGYDANGNLALYTPTGTSGLMPFAASLVPSFSIFLAGITSHTGGGAAAIDGINVLGVTQILVADVSIADNDERWKLRPFQMGDLNVSDGVTTIVPVVNPNNLRWIRTR